MQDKEDILNENRQKIDFLDHEILRLLNERAKLSVNIARIKSQNKISVFVPEREKQLLEQIICKNIGPLNEHAIRNIFSTIMEESKKLQSNLLTMDNDKNLKDDQE